MKSSTDRRPDADDLTQMTTFPRGATHVSRRRSGHDDKLSASDGYTYLTRQAASLTRQVASADQRRAGQPLADYYTQTRNPPGRWLGTGAPKLGLRRPATEWRMRALFARGEHPNAETHGLYRRRVRPSRVPRRRSGPAHARSGREQGPRGGRQARRIAALAVRGGNARVCSSPSAAENPRRRRPWSAPRRPSGAVPLRPETVAFSARFDSLDASDGGVRGLGGDPPRADPPHPWRGHRGPRRP